MRIVVNHELCEANAVCAQRAPEVFHVDEEDRLQILIDRPGPAHLKVIEEAVSRCPRGALSLADD